MGHLPTKRTKETDVTIDDVKTAVKEAGSEAFKELLASDEFKDAVLAVVNGMDDTSGKDLSDEDQALLKAAKSLASGRQSLDDTTDYATATKSADRERDGFGRRIR